MERLTVQDEKIDGGTRRAIIDAREVRKEAMTVYWALKKYEDTGLTPEEITRLNTFDGSQAVKATAKFQEEQRKHQWIPISERLPKTQDGYAHVLVSMDDEFVCTTDYTDDDGFELWQDSGEVIAWMLLPEPYKPD